jgi:glycosyltransferase involved in cell wall biosynthesis
MVIDDGSTDDTATVLSQFSDPNLRVFTHPSSLGKGAGLLRGIREAVGTHLLVFDADSEYSPRDIAALIGPIFDRRAEIVYGVRLRGHRIIQPSLVHAFGNKAMTGTVNLLFGTAISDLHTCLKLLPLPLLRSMDLREHGFGLDTEITVEMLRRGFRPFEVPVSYVGRSKDEGKKIRLSDAGRCYWVMARSALRHRTGHGARDLALVPDVQCPVGVPERRRFRRDLP